MPPPPPPPPPLRPRAEATFHSALERQPAERDAFLAEVCGDDAVLIGEVRGLLAAHEGAGGLMRSDAALSPEVEAELARLKPEETGERIGRYKLLQEIGEGGFGTVWMAEQMEPVSRRVALKIIKLGMDTREVIARFEAERQALAMMDHPNIAKVFDAGATDKGRPFFVMELVKGIPITQYCDQTGLGTRERLALFGDVCSAINHAHQKGVIHRDIKPSNVMVTLHGDKPVVKVIDFGIAKATQGKLTDKTLFTRFEQFIGTPVYMSPEQASLSGLDIDTRSDIYALGILLYELLVGKPPFDGKSLLSAGYEEMRRIIREVDPVKPSSRISTMAGEERTKFAKARRIEPAKAGRPVESDLDWIVMKAIDKDRTRRYETANAFAQDIVRFLSDKAVSATPPSAGYLFRKFARRNKAALRVAAAITVVLVVATLVSTWQAVRATRAEKKTADTLKEVAAERDAKELARKDAEDIAKFLGEVFESPDPKRDGRTITVAETLDTAARKLNLDLIGQPARRAKLQATLGKTYLALGLARQAIPLQEMARDYFLTTFGPEHSDTLQMMYHLANSYDAAGRQDEALKLREGVLAGRRKALGPKDPETLAAMANLAISYTHADRRNEALKLEEEVLTLSRNINGPEDPDTLRAMHNLALSYANLGRKDEALKLQGEVLALRRKISGPKHPATFMAMQNLANSYSTASRKDEALRMREEVLTLRRNVLGPEHPDTLKAMATVAISYADAGRLDEALKLQDEVLTLCRKMNGPEHPDTLRAMHNLAISYSVAGRKDEALKLREKAFPLYRAILGPERQDTIDAMLELAICYNAVGRKDEALKLCEEVLALRRKTLGPEHPETLKVMGALPDLYRDKGERARAEALEKELAAAKAKAPDPPPASK